MRTTKNNPKNLKKKIIFSVCIVTLCASFTLVKNVKQFRKPAATSTKTQSIAVQSDILHDMLASNKNTTPGLLRAAKKMASIPTDRVALQEQYDRFLSEYEDTLWKEIEATGKLNRKKFAEIFEEHSYNFNKTNPDRAANLKPSTVRMIETTFADIGLNPKAIGITTYSNDVTSEAYAYIDRIHINERELLKLPERAQRFVVAHEGMHIKLQDHLTMGIVNHFLLKKGKPTKRNQQLYDSLCRFIEMRADVQAVLHRKDYALGCMAFFHDGAADNAPIYTNGIHPSNASRFRASRTILGQLDAIPTTAGALA